VPGESKGTFLRIVLLAVFAVGVVLPLLLLGRYVSLHRAELGQWLESAGGFSLSPSGLIRLGKAALPHILKVHILGGTLAWLILLFHFLASLFAWERFRGFYIKVGAVAGLTIRDSMRKRVALTLILFAIVIVGVSQFFPVVEPEDRIKMVISVCTKGTAFFSTLVAIFLAATSLPLDISDKTIFTVLTKPIGRGTYLIGRFLGFAATLSLLVIVMNAVAYIFITGVARRIEQKGTTGPLLSAYQIYEPAQLERIPESPQEGQAEVQWLVMMDDRAAFKFENLPISDFPTDKVRCRINFLFSSRLGMKEEGSFRVVFTNPDGVRKEYTVSDAETDRPYILEMDPILLTKEGKLTATVERTDEHTYVGVDPKRLVLLGKTRSFLLNFARATAVTIAGVMAVVAVAILASTFLSASVSVLLTFFIYFCGNLVDLIRVVAQILRRPGGPLLGLYEPKFIEVSQAQRASSLINNIARRILEGLARILPDFRLFSKESELLQNLLIARADFAWTLSYALLIVSVSVLLGYCIFRFREVAK